LGEIVYLLCNYLNFSFILNIQNWFIVYRVSSKG